MNEEIEIGVITKWIEGMEVEVNFKKIPPLKIDEPPSFHGKGKGPSPLEVFLSSIGACTAATFAYISRKMGMEMEKINADVRGIASKEKGVWRIKKIEIRMNVLGSGVEDCFDEFQKYCAITESVKNGIPVELKLET
ncbi:MAG: OsmC family protein [Candidatus Syntropharchaeales archaeon]